MESVHDYFYPVQDANVNGLSQFPPDQHWDGRDSLDIGQDGGGGMGGRVKVYAICDGIIVAERHDVEGNDPDGTNPNIPGSGNYIAYQITDGGALNGCYVNCMHLYKNDSQYRVGTQIVKGQELGLVGHTGYSTGPHLHIQIREGGYWDDSGSEIDADKVKLDSTELRAGNPRGVTDYLFRCVQPKFKEQTYDSDDVRVVCTMAIKEARILGLIGMEEAIAVAYNRLNYWEGMETMLDVVSASGQFDVYKNNLNLFLKGGFTPDEIKKELGDSMGQQLLEFTSKLLNKKITLNNSSGWAEGYNPKIADAFFFNSSGPYVRGQLFARQNGQWCHWYGNNSCGGSTI